VHKQFVSPSLEYFEREVLCILQTGFGYSQWILLLVSGLGLVADATELLIIPFILPSAEVELCMDVSRKTWLSK